MILRRNRNGWKCDVNISKIRSHQHNASFDSFECCTSNGCNASSGETVENRRNYKRLLWNNEHPLDVNKTIKAYRFQWNFRLLYHILIAQTISAQPQRYTTHSFYLTKNYTQKKKNPPTSTTEMEKCSRLLDSFEEHHETTDPASSIRVCEIWMPNELCELCDCNLFSFACRFLMK